jgi:hypothetical protein
MLGQGNATCAFLSFRGYFACAKGTSVGNLINQRLAEKTMKAQGDNCSGPPDFVPVRLAMDT